MTTIRCYFETRVIPKSSRFPEEKLYRAYALTKTSGWRRSLKVAQDDLIEQLGPHRSRTWPELATVRHSEWDEVLDERKEAVCQ